MTNLGIIPPVEEITAEWLRSEDRNQALLMGALTALIEDGGQDALAVLKDVAKDSEPQEVEMFSGIGGAPLTQGPSRLARMAKRVLETRSTGSTKRLTTSVSKGSTFTGPTLGEIIDAGYNF